MMIQPFPHLFLKERDFLVPSVNVSEKHYAVQRM